MNMNEEYIDPFIESSSKIIMEVTGLKVKIGTVHTMDLPYKTGQLVILIGLTGEIQGNVILSFSTKLACKIASAMMGNIGVTEVDEISKSAISELCNMILGNAVSVFYRNNINVDITPPTVLTGENIQFSPNKSIIICLPLYFDDGEILEIYISYKEKIYSKI